MKLSHLITVIILSLTVSACTTGKINYRIDDRGQMVVEKTKEGEIAVRGSAAEASEEMAKYKENTVIGDMYEEYLKLLRKGDFKNAKIIRIEIEVLKGKIPSTPDTPVLTNPVVTSPKNEKEDPDEGPQAKFKRLAKRKKIAA